MSTTSKMVDAIGMIYQTLSGICVHPQNLDHPGCMTCETKRRERGGR